MSHAAEASEDAFPGLTAITFSARDHFSDTLSIGGAPHEMLDAILKHRLDDSATSSKTQILDMMKGACPE